MLGEALLDGRGIYALQVNENAKPYDGALSCLEIGLDEGGSIRVIVDWPASVLRISGDLQKMRTLGENISEFADVASGREHLHLEPLPEDDYFAADSNPLVVSLEA